MDRFEARCEVRWSDLDPNGHARHTAYMDWATHCRMSAFAAAGLSWDRLTGLGVAPLLFREETDYLREVRPGDVISVSFAFSGASTDWKHFSIRHRLVRADDQDCAQVLVRGAWFDLTTRRVLAPPEPIVRACSELPRTDDFQRLEGRNARG